LKVYNLICEWRVEDTCNFMEKRFSDRATKEANTGILKKFGRLIRTLFVVGVLIMLVGPSLKELYDEQMQDPSEAPVPTPKQKM